MKPRIFVSAVSGEFRTARQVVANTLHAMGYEPEWQDVFGMSAEEIRSMLRQKIDGCSAVLQIVGDAYGAEPPDPDPEFGRVSYTQFEALYAQSKKKRVYYLLAEDEFPRDTPPEKIDTPGDNTPEAVADAEQRRRLQATYRQQLLEGEQLYYPVDNAHDAELSVRRLRDDLARLRRSMTGVVTAVVALLLLIAGLGIWMRIEQSRQPERITEVVEEKLSGIVDEVADRMADPKLIRAQLEKTIEATYARDMAEAEEAKDWQKRKEARESAEKRRKERLASIDGFLKSISETMATGDSSPEFNELIRILEEQGVEEAIAYVQDQQETILERADRIAAASAAEIKRELAPILKRAELEFTKGRYEIAIEQAELVLARVTSWEEPFKVAFDAHKLRGDLRLARQGVETARADYERCLALAQQILQTIPDSALARRELAVAYDRLGELEVLTGDLQTASRDFYQRSLNIRKELSGADPTNQQYQRDLSISFHYLGRVSRQLGDLTAARSFHEQDLAIAQRLVEEHPNPRARADLSVTFSELGRLELLSGDFVAARSYFQESLNINQSLWEKQPENAPRRGNLAIAHDQMGDVYLRSNDLSAAGEHYRQSLKIREQLLEPDPGSVIARRSLLTSCDKLGDLHFNSDDMSNARHYYAKGLEIASQLAEEDPTNKDARRNKGVSYDKLANAHRRTGDLVEARSLCEKGLEIRKVLAGEDPNNAMFKRDVSVSYTTLGDVALQAGDPAAARGFYEQGYEIRKKLSDDDPASDLARRDLLRSSNSLGDVCFQLGDLNAAGDFYERCVQIHQQLVKNDSSDSVAQSGLADAYRKLADTLVWLEDLDAARRFYGQSLAIYERLAKENPSTDWAQHGVSFLCGSMGNLLWRTGDLAAAEEFLMKGRTILKRMADEDPSNAQHRRELCAANVKLGDLINTARPEDHQNAREFYEAAMEVNEKLAADDPTNKDDQSTLAQTYGRLSHANVLAGQIDHARDFATKALQVLKQLLAADPESIPIRQEFLLNQIRLGEIAEQSEDWPTAIKEYLTAQKLLGELKAQDDSLPNINEGIVFLETALARCHIRLGHVHLLAGSIDKAQEFSVQALQKLEELLAANPQSAPIRQEIATNKSLLGEIAEQSEDWATAIKEYSAALKILGELKAENESLPNINEGIEYVETALKRCQEQESKDDVD